jgi:hypothetical protein
MKAHSNEIDKLLKESNYKFLGWMNGWKHVYFNDNKEVVDRDKATGFGYLPKDYPEYCSCVEANHPRHEVSRGNRGYENTVSCDICKIYWKYDSSD